MIKNRIGRFQVSNEFLETEDGIEALNCVMKKFVPIIIARGMRKTTYQGYSKHFLEVKEGDPAPKYEVILEISHDIMSNDKWCVNFKEAD